MKKLTAFLLALVMFFSLTSCSFPFLGDPCGGDHVDDDGDLICDVCGSDIDPEDPDDNKDTANPDEDSYLAPTISEAIMAQLEEAGSMTIDMVLSLENYDSYYSYSLDDGSNDKVTDWEKYETLVKGDVTVSLTLSKTDKGFDAMIYVKSVDTSEEEPDVEEESYYLIDGSAYYWDYDLDCYVEVILPGFDSLMRGNFEAIPAALAGAITQLMDGFELPEEERKALEDSIGVIITGLFEIKNFEGALNVNYKTYFDDFCDYVNGIDSSTKTLESLVDDALHLVDEELSFAEIIGELERIAKLTLSDGLAELDAWLTEEYDTTIQGIYDEVVADARVEQIVRMYLEMMGAPGGEDPITDEDVQEFLAELKAVNVLEFIKSYYPEPKAVTVYDALVPILETFIGSSKGEAEDTELLAAEDSDIPPVNTLFGAIKDFFAMTVTEAVEEYGMPDFIASIKETLAGIKVNALSTSASISFSDSFSIVELNIGAKIDVEIETPTDFDETLYTENDDKIDFSLKISAISKDTVKIELPEGSDTVFGIWGSDNFFSDEDDFFYSLRFVSPDDEDISSGVYVLRGEVYSPDGCIEMETVIPFSAFKQETYIFSYTYYAFMDYSTYTTGTLSMTFDYEAFTYKINFIE